jgi:AAA domain
VTVTEFSSVPEPGAEPILGERGQIVLPKGGDLIYHGPGGSCKSGVSLDLGFHLAAGCDDWLGIAIPRAVPVLIVENEGPRPPLRERMQAKLEGWPFKPDLLHVLEEPWGKVTLQNEDHRAALADRIADLDVAVLMIGPLARVGMETAGTLDSGPIAFPCDKTTAGPGARCGSGQETQILGRQGHPHQGCRAWLHHAGDVQDARVLLSRRAGRCLLLRTGHSPRDRLDADPRAFPTLKARRP